VRTKQLVAVEPERRTDAAEPPRLRRWILLVEDDTELRHMVADWLRREGHEVVEARDGDEALGYLGPAVLQGRRSDAPALVVSDIRLPFFSGLEILEGLSVVTPRIPVILITAFGDEETHREAYQLGARWVLDKPFDLGELRTAVRAALPA
jgi:DNA-binding response OmpR family regulator